MGKTGLEAISEASSPQALAAAVAGAAEQVGFSCAQAMLSVPAEKPTAWVMRESSTNVISFDRAVLVGNNLSSGYDLGLGDPNQDPLALQLRQSPTPIIWSYEDYFHAGMEDLGDWWRETDKGFGVALAISILIDEFANR